MASLCTKQRPVSCPRVEGQTLRPFILFISNPKVFHSIHFTMLMVMLVTEVQNSDVVISDWPDMWAASQTEKMVIDPPLLAELPVPVNELIQEIPPYLTPLYNALQSRSTIQRTSLKKTFFSLLKIFHLLSYYYYGRTNVRNPLLALNFMMWSCWCLNTNPRQRFRNRASIQTYFYYLLL